MKIALPSIGENVDSALSKRLGRAEYIAFYTEDGFKFCHNEAVSAMGGAGVQVAQTMCDANVDTIIAQNVGPKAWKALDAAGIKVYKGIDGSVAENITAYQNQKLEQFYAANVNSHN